MLKACLDVKALCLAPQLGAEKKSACWQNITSTVRQW